MNVTKYWFLYLVLFPLWDFSFSQSCESTLRESGVIKSQGHPQAYPSYHNCRWTIQANPYDQVNILFQDFNVEPGENCDFDWLEISAMGNSKKFCGDKLSDVGHNGRLQLRGSVGLRLVSDDSVNLRGFSLQFQVVPGEPPPTTLPTTTAPTTTPPPSLTCDDDPCQNSGECSMIDAMEYYCFCEDGFTGERCEIGIDECASNPCENGATCVDGVNSWSCECVEGYIGESCSIDIDDCLRSSCKNGATCEDRVNSFHCACVEGWTGWDCGTEIDECDPNPCLHNGVCEDHLGYHSCICFPKYTGENCSIPLETESTELPEKYRSSAPFTTVAAPTVAFTTPSEPKTIPKDVPRAPSLHFQTTEAPKTKEQLNKTDDPNKSAPNRTSTPNFSSQTTTPSSLNFPTIDFNETLANVTIANTDPDGLFGLPIPAIVGIVGGAMSFIGLAASVFRFFKSPTRPMKVQPMNGNIQRTGPYFQH